MNKFKTEGREVVEYYIDEEKGTVAAVLTVPRDIVAQEMMNIMNKSSGSAFMADGVVLKDNMLLNGVYRGVAHCHENDTFNETVGMRFAKARALCAYYEDRKRVSNRLKAIFADAAKRMELAANHNYYAIEHVQELMAEE